MAGVGEDHTQAIYARLAGLLFLWLIANAVLSTSVLSRVAGSGTFADTARRISASEHVYRAALAGMVLEFVSAAVLYFALYVTLRPVNLLLAQLAMIFSLFDVVLGFIVWMCAFVRLHVYTGTLKVDAGLISSQMVVDLLRDIGSATENIGGIAFGIGSLLFFSLFFKSRYIPRSLSGLGVAASGIWVGAYFGNLIFPELHGLFQVISFPPMGLAEIFTGFWLALFAVRVRNTPTVASTQFPRPPATLDSQS